MANTVNVVVTCTNRKTRSVPSALRLRRLKGRNLEENAAAWISRLVSHQAPGVPACELYSGDHWHVARSLVEEGLRSNCRVNIWVCSAGYGLVPLGAELRPYSATFTAENPDAVCRLGSDI